MSIRKYLALAICTATTLLAATSPAAAQVVVDDYEQNNGNTNTAGYWSDVWADTTHGSGGGLVADAPGAQKNGLNGGVIYYSNNLAEVSRAIFYSPVRTNAPFLDLSTGTRFVRFWIRGNEGTPAVDGVRLQGPDSLTQYAEVDFANCNRGTDYVSNFWSEIVIPVSNFLAAASPAFSLSSVASVALAMRSDSSLSGYSSLYIDDLQVATNAPLPGGFIVTNSLLVDDFEQDNGQDNSLPFWSGVYIYTVSNTSDAGFLPDFAGAQKNGARGGVVYYSNDMAETIPIRFYTVLNDSWPHLDLSQTPLHVRFWIKANEGTPAIDKVILEGEQMTDYAQVSFADYNGGTAAPGDWFEVSIPTAAFLGDTAGSFSLARVKTLALTFDSASSVDGYSAICLDDIQIATDAAPPPVVGTPVTNTMIIDNFEQNNGQPNTIGYWSAVWADEPRSVGGLIPDYAGVQKNGARGGILYYSNRVDEPGPVKFYSVLSTNWPYLDLTRTNLYLRFWIKGQDNTPAIDKVILEGLDQYRFGRVSFADFNGGSAAVRKDWYEISIPVTNFAADTGGGFTLKRTGLLAFTFAAESSTGVFSSVFIDDLQLATEPAPAVQGVPVTNTLVIDNFEQNNGNNNSMGLWSDMWYKPSESTAGIVPDFPGVQKNGSYGGVLYYSNKVSAAETCSFYNVLSETWPYVDLSAEGLALRFWIKGDAGTVVIDQVALKGGGDSQWGRVEFADWNSGSAAVAGTWREIVIPLASFLGDTTGGFSLQRVSALHIKLDSASSVDQVSSAWIDDIRLAGGTLPVDLSVTKTGAPDPLVTGSSVVFTITLSNAGSDSAAGVTVTDTLSASMVFDAAASSPGLAEDGGMITYNAGSLAGGASTSLTIAVTIQPATAGVVTNRVTVTTSSGDASLSDNEASAEIAVPDTDGNGVPDFEDPDDDADGIPDTWEIQHFGGPTNAAAGGDGDGDGADNHGEYVADTDPGNSNSVFVVEGFTLLSPPTLSFTSSAARVYDVLYTTNLLSGSWPCLATNLAGNGDLRSVPDPAAASYRAYRVRVRVP
ncbi:MAG: DUF11 domain-containing protein [Kiritimatiellae bacterium]|nr:DUF11 domain-containing protein [Kiritimatiellia bacterium]